MLMRPTMDPATVDKILVFVRPGKDVTIHDIAKATGINRNTAAKYVIILEAQKKLVLTRMIGTAKLYTAPIHLPKEEAEST